MTGKNIMRDFVIHELSAVDYPAQEHAKMTMMKRADPFAKLAKLDMPEARGFAQLLAENEARAKCWEAEQKLWPLFTALRESLSSIAVDPAIGTPAKLTRVQESVRQFIEALRQEWPDVAEEVEKIAKASPDAADMAAFIKAGVSGVASEGDNLMAEDVNKVATLEKQVADLTKERDDAVAAKAKAEEDSKEKEDALAEMKKANDLAKGDEVLKVGETEVRKSAVGDASFAMLKAQQGEIAKERDARLLAELTKRAGDDYGHLPGTDVEKAALLKHLNGATEEVRKTADQIMKAGEDGNAQAFINKGHGGGGNEAPVGGEAVMKARGDYAGKIGDIQKRDSIPRTQAMQKARKEYPDLFKAAYPQEDAA